MTPRQHHSRLFTEHAGTFWKDRRRGEVELEYSEGPDQSPTWIGRGQTPSNTQGLPRWGEVVFWWKL